MVNPISNAGGKVAMPPALSPEAAFKKINNTNKGYITESDLASAIVQLSPEGVNLSQTETQSIAKAAFGKMDVDSDGKVSLSEFKAAAPKNGPPGAPPPGRPSGPPPGPPLDGGAGGEQGVQATNTSSASQTYDAADTNQDGTVSESERLAYVGKQISSLSPDSMTGSGDAMNAGSDEGVTTKNVL